MRAAHESRRDRAFEKNLPWESARALLVEAFCPSQIKWSDAERAKNERFARVMSGGMRDYEGWEEVRAFKTELFSHVNKNDDVVEIGIGSAPNLQYYGSKAKRVRAVEQASRRWRGEAPAFDLRTVLNARTSSQPS